MESFDSLLTCCICLDRFRNPKLLPCQHTFCMEPCMEGLIDYVKRQVKCPECRAEHRIPYKGIQEFPSNVTMQRFLEMYQTISGELPDPNQGQVMERCSICNEKEYLQVCAHCDKKICPDCKSAHIDVLKREVVRINNQVRRGLHKLYDILSQVDKNAGTVQQNCQAVHAEVESLGERLIKAVRDRTEVLKGEVDAHMVTEVRNLSTLKGNLELEIANIESNSDLAEKHMTDHIDWDDCELMDAKEIFLKTVEFIRNFEQEAPTAGDFRRPVRFSAAQDPNLLHKTLEHFGELNIAKNALTDGSCITNGNTSNGYTLMHSSSSAGPGLMRSKSDHRLVSQLRQQEERYGDESGRSSPVTRRRFGDRMTGRRDSEAGVGDDSGGYDTPCERRHKYRSRFTRRNLDIDDDLDSYRPDPASVARDEPAKEKKKEREKVLDTDDASRGPLSGITRIADVPRVIQKLADAERVPKKRSEPAPAEPTHTPAPTQPVPWRRQRSEEDEISKIKKQNKEADARCSRGGAMATVADETPSPRAASVSRTSAERRTPSQSSTPTSTLQRPRLSREESGSETEDSTRRRSSRVSRPSSGAPISEGANEPSATRRAPLATPQRKVSEPVRGGSPRTVPNVSRSSSGGSLNTVSLETPRLAPLRNTWERRFSRSNSSESTSSESSTSATAGQPKPTGAAFSTNELKSRFMRGGPPPPPPDSSRGRYSVSGASPSVTSRPPAHTAAAADAPSSPTTAPTRPRFQSRFLGRACTPKADGSKESSSSSGSSESESESSDSGSDSDDAPASSFRSRATKNMAKTSIGPLLARSAHARSSAVSDSTSPVTSPSTTVPSSRLTRPSTLSSSYGSRRDSSAAEYTPTVPNSSASDRYTSRYAGTTDTSPTTAEPKPYETSRYGSTTNRYGSTDYTPSNGLMRSRTSSHLDSRSSTLDSPDTYSSYSSKYSRPSRSSAYDDYTPPSRYSSYSSRFLNRGEGSAALAESVQAAAACPGRTAAACPDPTASVAGGGRTPGTSPYAHSSADEDTRRGGRARSTSSDEAGERGSSGAKPQRLPASRQDADSDDTSASNDTGAELVVPAKSRRKSEALSNWAQHLKNKYGYTTNMKDKDKAKTVRRSKSSHLVRLLPAAASAADSSSVVAPSPPGSVLGGCPVRDHYLQMGRMKLKIGSRGGGPGQLTWPRGIAVGPDNAIVVADSSNHRVQVFDQSGAFVKEFGQYGNGEAEFDCLAGVSVNRIGQFIISDRYNHRVQLFDPSGRFLRAFGQNGTMEGRFNYPWGVTTDALGFIYVCDKENHRVQVFQSDGTFVGTIGSQGRCSGQLAHPHYIAVSATNRVVVTDSNNHRVQVFDVNGKCLTTFGGEGSEDGKFKFPRGVAVDDQGYIVVGDSGNHRIQIFHPDGAFLKAFGCWGNKDGEFKGLEGVAVTSAGNVLVCDRENHRVQVF